MKLGLIILVCCLAFATAGRSQKKASKKAGKGISCKGEKHSTKATAYYPADDPVEGGFFDCRDTPLHTLQAFLKGDAEYVDVAMDEKLKIKYGTELCIPEMNKHYGVNIKFKVTDTGPSFTGKGFSRIDICVKDKKHSHEDIVNGKLTLVFPKIKYGSPYCRV